jgi:hypothetical protein
MDHWGIDSFFAISTVTVQYQFVRGVASTAGSI